MGAEMSLQQFVEQTDAKIAALQAQAEALRAERNEARQEAATLRNGLDYAIEERNAAWGDRDGLRRELHEARARLAVAEATAERWKSEGNVWNAHPEGTTDASLAERRARADEMLVILQAVVGGAAEGGRADGR